MTQVKMVNRGIVKMKNQVLTLNQVRKEGLDALLKALGPIGMIRFLQQFETGKGNYTIERDEWLGDMTVKDVLEELERNQDLE
jgi:hypothetical protein